MSRTVNVLDLFSGIGGFSLGLERAGMTTVAFCEIDSYCRGVLRKHWPKVPIYEDVRELTADTLRRDGITDVDLICGGFPCQDLSFAGKRAGLEGERSGLWGEYRRLIGEIRPRWVFAENVPGLLSLGMARVLGDLSALGYDAVWDCVPASAIGAPHRRDRVWIVAHDAERGRGDKQTAEQRSGRKIGRPQGETGRFCGDVANSERIRSSSKGNRQINSKAAGHREANWAGGGGEDVANANGAGLERRNGTSLSERGNQWTARPSSPLGDALGSRELQPQGSERNEWGWAGNASWWQFEPNVGRVAYGVPSRMDRLKGLGNAVVPTIPEIWGKVIMGSIGHED